MRIPAIIGTPMVNNPGPSNSSSAGSSNGVNNSTDINTALDFEREENDRAWERTQQSQQTAMDFENWQALRQMQFQERMSNTEIQRRMADADAAGLNPLLVGQFGSASSPSGVSASGHSASAPKGDMLQAYLGGLNSARQDTLLISTVFGKLVRGITNIIKVASK